MSRLLWYTRRKNSTLQVEGVNQFPARVETETEDSVIHSQRFRNGALLDSHPRLMTIERFRQDKTSRLSRL